jgi:copper(I)-binding protein
VSRNSRRAVAIVAGLFAAAPLVSACASGEHPQTALPTQLAEGVNATVNGVDVRNAFLLGPVPGQRLTAGGSAPLYAWFVNKGTGPDRLLAVEAAGVAKSAEISGGALTLPPGQLVATVRPPGTQASPTTSGPPSAPSSPPSTTPTPARSRTPKGPGKQPVKAPVKTSATPAPGASASGITPPAAPPAAPQAPQPSKIVLKGLAKDFGGGETVRLILHFQRAGAVTLSIPFVPRSGYYATYSPAPAEPAPSATPLSARPQTTVSGTPKTSGAPKASGTPMARKPKKASATPAV